jgi:hypothetical protein
MEQSSNMGRLTADTAKLPTGNDVVAERFGFRINQEVQLGSAMAPAPKVSCPPARRGIYS